MISKYTSLRTTDGYSFLLEAKFSNPELKGSHWMRALIAAAHVETQILTKNPRYAGNGAR